MLEKILEQEPRSYFDATLNRRDFLARSAFVTLSLSTLSCLPAYHVLDSNVGVLRKNLDLQRQTYRAFAETIIPGIDVERPKVVDVFFDKNLPFAKHHLVFLADLCRCSAKLFNARRFDELTPSQRSAVVQEGLTSGDLRERLYTGAVFLCQVANYSGIYDPPGCALIDWEGEYAFQGLDCLSYQGFDGFAPSVTENGNLP